MFDTVDMAEAATPYIELPLKAQQVRFQGWF
jgi:hypothetical protein